MQDCSRCNNSGYIACSTSTARYVRPGPVPETARHVFETFCDCDHGSAASRAERAERAETSKPVMLCKCGKVLETPAAYAAHCAEAPDHFTHS